MGIPPPLAVLAHPLVTGLRSFEAGAPGISVVPFKQALAASWDTDAHLVGYLTEPWDSGEPFFRLTLDVLPEIARLGGRVVLNYACVEWDTGVGDEHAPWSREAWERFSVQWGAAERATEALSEGALSPAELLASAVARYATRKGFRWIFRLDPPVPVDRGEADATIRGLVQVCRAGGLLVDERASGWHRLFRLPRVLRDGRLTEEDPYFFCEAFDRTTPSEKIPRASGVATPHLVDARRPARDEADALLAVYQSGRRSLTPLAKAARERLRGRDYHAFLFDETLPVIERGQRHDTLKAWIASATGLLSNIEGVGPEFLYALFLIVADHLAVDEPSRDWDAEIWSLVKNRWAVELERIERENTEKQNKATQVLDTADQMIEGVRWWYPELPVDRGAAWAWISRRLIVSIATSLHVMLSSGWYSKYGVSRDQLLAQIINLGLDAIIPTRVPLKKGGDRLVTVAEILERHAVVASEAAARPEIEGGYLERIEAENPKIILKSFRRRRDLVPEFFADVDIWLRALGGSKYETLCRQIGCFLAFEKGAVAGMSVVTDPGAGKKMLVHGLMECLEEPAIATARDLVEHFNEGIIKSPFLNANEGLPVTKGYMHVSDTYRALITGDFMPVNAKYKPVILVRNPMRIMLTGNNDGLVMSLCKDRDLAPADREAIAVRLNHYNTGSAATKLLESKGGWSWTKGWIAGDSGEPSRFIVARHFLWLWEQHGKNAEPTDRHGLLLAGDRDSPIVRQMQVQGGGAPAVIESLVGILGSNMPLKPDRVRIESGHLWVTTAAVLDYWRVNLSQGATEKLWAARVGSILKGLIVAETTSIGGVAERWKEIDIRLLRDEAEKHGWGCRRLDELARAVAGQNGNGAGHHGVLTTETSGRIG